MSSARRLRSRRLIQVPIAVLQCIDHAERRELQVHYAFRIDLPLVDLRGAVRRWKEKAE